MNALQCWHQTHALVSNQRHCSYPGHWISARGEGKHLLAVRVYDRGCFRMTPLVHEPHLSPPPAHTLGAACCAWASHHRLNGNLGCLHRSSRIMPGMTPWWFLSPFWKHSWVHDRISRVGKRGILSTTAVVSTARTAQVLTTTWVKLSRNTPVWRKKAGFTINYLTWCSLHTAGDEGRSTNYEFSLMDISPKLFPVLACGWRTGKKRYAGHAPQHAACLCC